MPDAGPLLEALAALVEYPDREFPAALRRCREIARAGSPEVCDRLDRFEGDAGAMSIHRLQEAYIEVFDLDPGCALDLGWHLHGERRERGELLASLRERLRAAGVAETRQLPDHLTHVLALLARQPAEERARLAGDCLAPLEQIRQALRRRGSPYAPLLDAVHCAVAGCAIPATR